MTRGSSFSPFLFFRLAKLRASGTRVGEQYVLKINRDIRCLSLKLVLFQAELHPIYLILTILCKERNPSNLSYVKVETIGYRDAKWKCTNQGELLIKGPQRSRAFVIIRLELYITRLYIYIRYFLCWCNVLR